MSKQKKLIEKLCKLPPPTDYTWNELVKLLEGFGFTESNAGKTSGSAKIFVHGSLYPIRLHKPHPSNQLKVYALIDIKKYLKEHGLI